MNQAVQPFLLVRIWRHKNAFRKNDTGINKLSAFRYQLYFQSLKIDLRKNTVQRSDRKRGEFMIKYLLSDKIADLS